MNEVVKLIFEYDDRRRELERQVQQRQMSRVTASQLTGDTPDERYVRRAIEEELTYLASRIEGSGECYPSIIPTAMRLESLRLSDWLAPEARALIDTQTIVLDGAAQNGSLAWYGESHLRKAIDWGMTHAEPRQRPTDWGKEVLGNSLNSDESAAHPIVPVNYRFMREITADAIEALLRANDPPRLFRRGSVLVRLVAESPDLAAEPCSIAALKGELDRAADFVKAKTRQKDNKDNVLEQYFEPARPPQDVVNDLLARPGLPFPVLTGFATCPVFLPDGNLLVSEGYDPVSDIYLGLMGLRLIDN